MDTKTFLENFGHIAEAPNGVQKLREMILQIAVRGKLSHQNSSDESANELLEKVYSEKKRLVKEGKLRKITQLPDVSDGEVEFDSPNGWVWERLGNYVYLEMGQSPSSKFYNQENNGLPFFQGKADFGDLYPTPRYWCTEPQKYSYPGDVLLSVRAPVGPTNITNIECCIGRGLAALRPLADASTKYLMILMRAFQKKLESFATGTTFSAVSKKHVESLVVSVPPLEEQKRIVAKVDQLMALCDQLETQKKQKAQTRVALNNAALDKLLTTQNPDEFNRHWQRIANNFYHLYDHLENLGEFREVILELAIRGKLVEQNYSAEPASEVIKKTLAEKKKQIETKVAKDSGKMHQKAPKEPPFEIPSNWEWVRFRDVIWCFRGHNPPKSDFINKPKNGYVRFIQITDFKTDDRAVYVPKSNKLKMVYKDEIIMAAYRHIGKLSRRMEGAFNVALCKVLEFSPMDRDFVEMLIGTDVVKGELLRASERGHIPSMHSDHLLSLLVPIPPVEEQKRIVAKVDQLMALCDQLEAQLKQTQSTSEKLVEATVNSLVAA